MSGEDFESVALWLGKQSESYNLTWINDEQTTEITIDVEVLAERILASDWLAARVASAADSEAVERVRALADEWRAQITAPFGEAHMSYAFAFHALRAALSVPTEAEGTS